MFEFQWLNNRNDCYLGVLFINLLIELGLMLEHAIDDSKYFVHSKTKSG
ncbi:MAG: hypothetical protein K9I69_04785 [Ignavibacteriales bacterium]|nr:hypothetical protein [Ignavibacteriales bacterium]MCF8435917.1 hypothetical protein [Ignavibacteriales bacterium]